MRTLSDKPIRYWIVFAVMTIAVLGTLSGFVLAIVLPDATSVQRHGGTLGYFQDGVWIPFTENDHERLEWGAGAPHPLKNRVQWKTVIPGLQLGVLELKREWWPQSFVIKLYRFDDGKFSFRVIPAAEVMGEWSTATEIAQKVKALFAINANYFSSAPLGLVVHKGRLVAPRSSAMPGYFIVPKSGVGAEIRTGQSVPAADALEAAQSFPVLLMVGKIPAYMRTGKSEQGKSLLSVDEVARRSAVAQMSDKSILFLVTDTITSGLTFSELATVLGALGVESAIGLDGGGSTQAYLSTTQGVDVVVGKDRVPIIITAHPARQEVIAY